MTRRTKQSRHSSGKTRSSSDAKGRILEKIAAFLHEGSNADIEIRATPPPLDDPSDRREIDVLLSGQLAGYPVRFAVECRNWKKKMGPAEIDGFVGKLEDVGIPSAHGIFVSAAGYTKGAIRRAKKAGIRPLMLQGLSEDRLNAAIHEALQTTILLFPEMNIMSRFEDSSDTQAPAGFAVNERLPDPPEGVFGQAAMLDFLSHLWRIGKIPSALGDHYCFLRLPEEFRFFSDDPVFRNGIVFATIRVHAVVFSIIGEATAPSLIHAETRELDRARVDVKFPTTAKAPTSQVFSTEADLSKYLNESDNKTHLVTRIKLPRLQFQAFWWPISQQALERFREQKQQGGEPTFDSVEGSNLARAWEFFQTCN